MTPTPDLSEVPTADLIAMLHLTLARYRAHAHVERSLAGLSRAAVTATEQVKGFARAWHDSVVHEAAALPPPDLYRRRFADLSREPIREAGR